MRITRVRFLYCSQSLHSQWKSNDELSMRVCQVHPRSAGSLGLGALLGLPLVERLVRPHGPVPELKERSVRACIGRY